VTVNIGTISDPESDLNNINDFVYAPELGEASFVYVIDDGVNIHVLNVRACAMITAQKLTLLDQPKEEKEFKSYNDPDTKKDQVLQTDKSKATNKNEGDEYRDDAPEGIFVSHGTSVASKAARKQFGLAREVRSLLSRRCRPCICIDLTLPGYLDFRENRARRARGVQQCKFRSPQDLRSRD
jgi:hypothetical protein